MPIRIRRATRSDAAAAAALYLQARRAAAAGGSVPPLPHSDQEVLDWMTHSVLAEREPWVAEECPHGVVGLLVLAGEWIDQLYVGPDHTGRGIGTRLLDLAKRERPQGLRLWTFVSNTGAQRFYERNGFTQAARTDGSHNDEGAPDIQYAWDPHQTSVQPG